MNLLEDSELEKRVALHSAAWAPASRFNMAQYLKVRGMSQVFDQEIFKKYPIHFAD